MLKPALLVKQGFAEKAKTTAAWNTANSKDYTHARESFKQKIVALTATLQEMKNMIDTV